MADEKNDEKTASRSTAKVDAPESGDPMPTAEEAPLPKGVPKSPLERQQMMAEENAEAHRAGLADGDEQTKRQTRADLMARENKGIVVTAKEWAEAI